MTSVHTRVSATQVILAMDLHAQTLTNALERIRAIQTPRVRILMGHTSAPATLVMLETVLSV